MDAFKTGAFNVFVGSIKRFCEGIDLAWLNGSMILYSLTFSGSTYEQILNRMNRFDRIEPIKVHVLLVKNSIEEKIFAAVSNKKNFNTTFMKQVKEFARKI
jgi:SNF2 family DNA or RNA helicase